MTLSTSFGYHLEAERVITVLIDQGGFTVHLMVYLEVDLSVPLKYVMSEPISGGRVWSWTSIMSSVLVGEGGGFGDRIGLLGASVLIDQGCFGIGCFMIILRGDDNESLHFFLSLFLRHGFAYVSDSF